MNLLHFYMGRRTVRSCEWECARSDHLITVHFVRDLCLFVQQCSTPSQPRPSLICSTATTLTWQSRLVETVSMFFSSHFDVKVAKLKECMVSHAFSPDICVLLGCIAHYYATISPDCIRFLFLIDRDFQHVPKESKRLHYSLPQHCVKIHPPSRFRPRCVAEDTHVFRYALQLGWAPSEKQRVSRNKAISSSLGTLSSR